LYENFNASDDARWSGEVCIAAGTRANIVAIATRHADAVDIRFDVSGRPSGSPCPVSPGSSRRNAPATPSRTSSAAQAAGLYLKKAIESGYDNGREMYTMTIDEVLEHVDAILHEAGHTRKPALPDSARRRSAAGLKEVSGGRRPALFSPLHLLCRMGQ